MYTIVYIGVIMEIEKNMLYQILIISVLIAIIPLWTIFWQLMLLYPIILFLGLIFLTILRREIRLEDERSIRISEKASEKAVIVFILGSIFLLFSSGFVLFFNRTSNFPGWIIELFASMFQSAFILGVIYLIFYFYYRYTYGG